MNKLYAINRMRGGDWIDAWNFHYGSSPSRAVLDKFSKLPEPLFHVFKGWQQFDRHLQSLQEIIPRLREIEEFANMR